MRFKAENHTLRVARLAQVAVVAVAAAGIITIGAASADARDDDNWDCEAGTTPVVVHETDTTIYYFCDPIPGHDSGGGGGGDNGGGDNGGLGGIDTDNPYGDGGPGQGSGGLGGIDTDNPYDRRMSPRR